MVMFNERMRPEVIQPFWAALQAGEFITDAAAEGVGTYRVRAGGGSWPRAASARGAAADLKGRCLTFAEREEIALGRAAGSRCGAIAERLGRAPVDGLA